MPSHQVNRALKSPSSALALVKLRSMHLSVPGSIKHFLYIQEALKKSGTAKKAYLSKAFNREILHWQRLYKDLLAWPRFLAQVVQRLLTKLGFCDASGTGAGGVWIDPDGARGGGCLEGTVASRHYLIYGSLGKPCWWHYQVRNWRRLSYRILVSKFLAHILTGTHP